MSNRPPRSLEELAEYMKSVPLPSSQELSKLLAETRWVRIASPTGKMAPQEVHAPAQIAELRDCLAIVEPGESFMCMCPGSVSLELHDSSRMLEVISVHHGESIQAESWASHAMLRDGRKVLEWLAACGVTQPLRDEEKRQQLRLKAKQQEERWKQAMPSCLAPFWDPEFFGSKRGLAPLLKALEQEFPLAEERVRVLLNWLGHGEGPWSEFPAYETLPELLLLEHPTQLIVSVLSREDLSPPELEGGARYLAGWSFSKEKPQDLRLLPEKLRERLLQHSLASQDEDRKRRARSAFSKPAP